MTTLAPTMNNRKSDTYTGRRVVPITSLYFGNIVLESDFVYASMVCLLYQMVLNTCYLECFRMLCVRICECQLFSGDA